VGRFLCMIGLHRWLNKRNRESGLRPDQSGMVKPGLRQAYLECARCHKQKEIIRLPSL
jgi:hypothetical protein